MAKAMSKAQIVAHFAKKFDLKKKVAAAFFEEVARLAYKEAKNSFTLPGIGKLAWPMKACTSGCDALPTMRSA